MDDLIYCLEVFVDTDKTLFLKNRAGVRPPASKVRAGRQNRRSDRGVHKAIKAEGVDADGL